MKREDDQNLDRAMATIRRCAIFNTVGKALRTGVPGVSQALFDEAEMAEAVATICNAVRNGMLR